LSLNRDLDWVTQIYLTSDFWCLLGLFNLWLSICYNGIMVIDEVHIHFKMVELGQIPPKSWRQTGAKKKVTIFEVVL